MKHHLLPAIALAIFMTGAASAEENVRSTDPVGMAVTLRDLGYRATLEKDSVGDPMIVSKAAGLNFIILFYDCTDGQDCRSIQFSSSFTLNDSLSQTALNQWNLEKRYAKAHINDEGEIYLKYDVNMDGGGLSTANFGDTFDIWESLLADFKAHIDF